jgi:hypothetical protein
MRGLLSALHGAAHPVHTAVDLQLVLSGCDEREQNSTGSINGNWRTVPAIELKR